MEYDFWVFYKKSAENIEVLLKSDKNKGAFNTCILSHSSLLRMRNVPARRSSKNQNTHFMFNNFQK